MRRRAPSAGRAQALGARLLARRGIPSPGAEARRLLAVATGWSTLQLLTEGGRSLPGPAWQRYRQLLRRRLERWPFAYLSGCREFWGEPLAVNRAVLVPRPETEGLVERGLAQLAEGRRIFGEGAGPLAIDLCTGSGAVGLSLARRVKGLRVACTDLSAAALGVARWNARRLGVEGRVDFYRGDLWDALPACWRGSAWLVTCNPPYVAPADWEAVDPEVRREPRIALLAGEGGIAPYRRIVAGAPPFLRPGGAIALEVGAGLAERVAALLEGSPAFHPPAIDRDAAGLARIVWAVRRGAVRRGAVPAGAGGSRKGGGGR